MGNSQSIAKNYTKDVQRLAARFEKVTVETMDDTVARLAAQSNRCSCTTACSGCGAVGRYSAVLEGECPLAALRRHVCTAQDADLFVAFVSALAAHMCNDKRCNTDCDAATVAYRDGSRLVLPDLLSVCKLVCKRFAAGTTTPVPTASLYEGAEMGKRVGAVPISRATHRACSKFVRSATTC